MSVRAVLGIFIVGVLAACTAVIAPLEIHNANDPVQKAERGEIGGLDALSLLRSANATQALDAVHARSPDDSRIQGLYLRPQSLMVTVEVPAEGARRDFTVNAGFGVDVTAPHDAISDRGARFGAFDMTAPERMAGAVLAELSRPAADLDYFVAGIPSEGEPGEWVLYLKGGPVRDRTWRADAHGAHARRNG